MTEPAASAVRQTGRPCKGADPKALISSGRLLGAGGTLVERQRLLLLGVVVG